MYIIFAADLVATYQETHFITNVVEAWDRCTDSEQATAMSKKHKEILVASLTTTYTPNCVFDGVDEIPAFIFNNSSAFGAVKINFDGRNTSLEGDLAIMAFGQSNGGILHSSGAIQDAIDSAGSSAVVFSTAQGGTSAALPDGPWNIIAGDGEDTPGSAYTGMISTVQSRITTNPNEVIAGAIWWHGENDSFNSLDYEGPVKAVFEGLFAHVGYEFPIYLIGTSQYQSIGGNWHQRNLDLQALAADPELPTVRYIDLDGQIMAPNGITQVQAMADNFHYNQVVYEKAAEVIISQAATMANLGLSNR